MKKLTAVFIALLLTVTAFSQYRNSYTPSSQSAFRQPSAGGLFSGLVDQSRLSMSQSYSLSYTSSGSNGFMQGMYLNNMRYRLSNPFTLNLQLGFIHTPYNSYSGNGLNSLNAEFVGGANLVYKPSNNVSFSIGVSRMPYYYSPYSYNPYGYFSGDTYYDPSLSRPKELSPEIDGK
jgi:hypothetical protein